MGGYIFSRCFLHGVAAVHTRGLCAREWCDGVRIDDKAGLKAMGTDVRQLAARVQRIFARMTFVHGFLHCDPHPGNILVGPGGRVVLLDHGVYR